MNESSQPNLRRLRIITGAEEVSYESYCAALDLHTGNIHGYYAGFFDNFKLPGALTKLFKDLGGFIKELSDQLKIGLGQVVDAFKQKDVFAFLKAVGFNLNTVLHAIQSATKALSGGILKVFKEIHKSGVVQQIQKGTMRIDEVLDKYPVLKKLSGMVIAGILIYIWLNMSFLGDMDYDLDLGVIVAALHGGFSLTNLFTSPSGLMMLALLGTGMMGLSFPWLGKSLLNIVMALTYTGFKKLKESQLMGKLKPLMEFKRL